MKIFKTILKSIGLLLAGAIALTSCQNNIDNSEPHLVLGNSSTTREVAAEYTITDFNSYKITGVYEDYLPPEGEENPSVLLGNWSTYSEMLKAYIPIPNTGNWTFTLEASKSGTKYAQSKTINVTSGENSITFELSPVEYGTEGKGNVQVGVQIQNLPYQVTVSYNYETYNCEYSIDVLGYEVTTTCADEALLENTLTLALDPMLDAEGNEISYIDRFGTTEGTYSYSGNFTATLTAADVPAGEYDVTFHLNKNNLKNIKNPVVTIIVTDEKTSESEAEVSYDYTDSIDGIAVIINACEYSISYELNGGSFEAEYTAASTYNSFDENNVTLPAAENVSKFGYTFAGWYTTSTFDENTAISEITGNGIDGGNKTLYAKWDLNTYTITYDFGDGYYYGYYPTTYTVESSTITLPNPYSSTTGYEFKGWYTTSTFDAETKLTEITSGTKAENLTIYAKYGPVSHKIYYTLNGGTNPAGAPSEFYSDEGDTTLPTPSRTGYNFNGWYESSYFSGSPIFVIASGTTTDVYVYAKWTLATYTITYHNYYTDGTNYSSTYTYDDTNKDPTTALLTPPARDGYEFYMWNSTSSFDSSSYYNNLPYQSTGNLDFYSKWNIVDYSITYNTNGGTMSAYAATSYNIESAAITLEAPAAAPDGCTFDSWYTTSDFQTGTAITEISTGTHGDINLYAKYSITGYTITYNVNGGTMPETYAIAFSGTYDIALPRPTRTEYNFMGWYTTSTLDDGTEITQINEGTADNVEVWAKWEKTEWTLSSSGSYTFTQNEYTWTSNNQGINNSSATAIWTITLTEDSTVSIPYSVSSESNWDKLTILLDSVTRVSNISGSQSGTISATLTSGTHTLSATYYKDSSNSKDDDCGTLTLNPVMYN